MERFFGLFGIAVILGIAFLLSRDKKHINYRVVLSGLGLQIFLAVFILRTTAGESFFGALGYFITRLLDFSDQGARFVFGVFMDHDKMDAVFGKGNSFIFFFKIVPTIIFVAVLVSIGYYLNIIQRLVSIIARVVYWIMGVSGSEALSNVSSAFVGQVEAQFLIKPYVDGMTMSELLASMAGSMACIAGGVMAVYIAFGVPAQYLLAASIMAAPGALVISKIVYPETEVSQTKGIVKLKVEKPQTNLVGAIVNGASDGLKVALNVIAMLIGFIAIIALLDAGLGLLGRWMANYFSWDMIGVDLKHFSLNSILGSVFAGFAYVMGVPVKDIHVAGSLMGTKMVTNEFLAYYNLSGMLKTGQLSPKTITIVSFALCGFANFSSIGIQVGGIGELAPSRKKDLAKLGFRALICGTLASYLSATIAGILM